jgi:acyl-CoA thioesterase
MSGPAAPEARLPGWDLADVIDPDRPLTLTVPSLLCAEGGFLFGGWAMALLAQIARAGSGRAVRSLSCEFLAPIRAGDDVTVTLGAVRVGARIGHYALTLSRDGETAVSSRIVTGDAPGRPLRAWAPAPVVPEPDTCPERTYRYRGTDSAIDTLDIRLASPEPSPEQDRGGRVLLWARVRCQVDPTGALAALSDHVPYLIVRSLAGVRQATTVSSTVRITGTPTDDWVLLEVELAGTDGRFCVGRVRQWGRDGALVAVADQTTYLRLE